MAYHTVPLFFATTIENFAINALLTNNITVKYCFETQYITCVFFYIHFGQLFVQLTLRITPGIRRHTDMRYNESHIDIKFDLLPNPSHTLLVIIF